MFVTKTFPLSTSRTSDRKIDNGQSLVSNASNPRPLTHEIRFALECHPVGALSVQVPPQLSAFRTFKILTMQAERYGMGYRGPRQLIERAGIEDEEE